MSYSRPSFDTILNALKGELAPYPGRLSGTLRDVLGLIISIIIAMTLRLPGIALALALILLLQRQRPGITLRSSIEFFAGASSACAVTLVLVQLTDSTEVARFLSLGIIILLSGFCMVTTRFPLFFTLFGFYSFADLAGWDLHRSPTAIVKAALFNVASLGLVLLVTTVIEFLFSSVHPLEELQQQMATRLKLLSRFYRELSEPRTNASAPQMSALHHQLVQLAHAGDIRMHTLYDELHDSNRPEATPVALQFRIGLLTRILEKSAFLPAAPSKLTEAQRADYAPLADLCHKAIDATQPVTTPAQWNGNSSPLLTEIFTELTQYIDAEDLHPDAVPTTQKPAPVPFSIFLTGAFSNGEAFVYTLKLTLSAMVCYIIYNAIAWPAILTCVVTVLFTGLSSTGAMKQKQLYRLSGAAIGGAIGIFVESVFFPNMDSITSLVILVAVVAFLGVWVSRSPRISYVGVQIVFAFFLTTMSGFSAATQIAPARDRVIGVALGILVLWFVFDQLWPTRTSDLLNQLLTQTRNATAMLQQAHIGHQNLAPAELAKLRAEVSMNLAALQSLTTAAYFDIGRNQHRELARTRRLTREVEAAAADFYTEAYGHARLPIPALH